MKQTAISSALQTGVHALQWLICHSWGKHGLQRFIQYGSHVVKVVFIQIREPDFWVDCRYQLSINFNHKLHNTWQRKLQLCRGYQGHVLSSDSLGSGSHMSINFYDIPTIAPTLPRISGPQSWIPTHVLNGSKTDCIVIWDWEICSARSGILICTGSSGVLDLWSQASKSWGLAANYGAHVFHSDIGTSDCLDCCYWQLGLANKQWLIHHNDICPGVSRSPEIGSYASTICGLAMIKQAVSHILTQAVNIA